MCDAVTTMGNAYGVQQARIRGAERPATEPLPDAVMSCDVLLLWYMLLLPGVPVPGSLPYTNP